MKEVNRRDVLRAASGAAALTAAQYSRVKGANERVKLGVIGCGGRGTLVMNVFKNNPVDIVAVCDVWGDPCGTRAGNRGRVGSRVRRSPHAGQALHRSQRVPFHARRQERAAGGGE